MKVQSKDKGKGKGIRAILCGFLCVCCVILSGINALAAGYTSETHPKSQLSPDGDCWTIIEELPYYDNYDTATEDRRHWNGKIYSFWVEIGREFKTGLPLNLPNPGVGQHEYPYYREGNVPVYKWVVGWDKSKCIHGWNNTSFGGFNNLDHYKCWGAYWSGLLPYCADCDGIISELYHYIKPETAQEIQYVNVNKKYYYFYLHILFSCM